MVWGMELLCVFAFLPLLLSQCSSLWAFLYVLCSILRMQFAGCEGKRKKEERKLQFSQGELETHLEDMLV